MPPKPLKPIIHPPTINSTLKTPPPKLSTIARPTNTGISTHPLNSTPLLAALLLV